MRYLIFAVLGIALLLAACSGSEDSQQQETSSAQTPAQQSEAETPDDSRSQTTSSTSSTTESRQQTSEEQQQQPEQQERTAAAATEEDSDSRQEQAATEDQQQSDADRPAQSTESEAEESDAQQDQAEAEQEQSEPQADEADEQPSAAQEEDQAEPEPQQAQAMQPEDEEEEQAESERDPGPSEAERLRLRAEEIRSQGTVTDLRGIVGWLNGEETSIALELAKGNVVLIDFWTYTCINCIRTLPFLTEWHDKYAESGLVIIGVHTPEFDFEKVPANIQAAIDQYGIQYRVPMDNDYGTWRAFNNRFWPAKYLIGPSMDVRYLHFGEGDYDETEVAIREALIDAGEDVSDIPFGTAAVEPVRDPDAGRQTRELYGGTRRNYRTPYAAQDEYYLQAGVEVFYQDIDTSRERRARNMWYLQGLWRNEEEAIVHARNTNGLEDYLAFDFIARTVNVVLTVAEDGEPFDVFIEMDGRWLRQDEAGDHIRWDDQGRSFIRVTTNDLYRLVKLEQWSQHELKLRSNSDQLQIFAFTFGSYVGGE